MTKIDNTANTNINETKDKLVDRINEIINETIDNQFTSYWKLKNPNSELTKKIEKAHEALIDTRLLLKIDANIFSEEYKEKIVYASEKIIKVENKLQEIIKSIESDVAIETDAAIKRGEIIAEISNFNKNKVGYSNDNILKVSSKNRDISHEVPYVKLESSSSHSSNINLNDYFKSLDKEGRVSNRKNPKTIDTSYELSYVKAESSSLCSSNINLNDYFKSQEKERVAHGNAKKANVRKKENAIKRGRDI